ncbi:tellurium resistance protein [Streptomyces sp. SID3343]|uniref:vWA domain-containing protein n=1 Tax=Streptomyces sp. SID3343 TaxID=2690260 RepID=UPI00136F9E8C|nr:tellurium resistance protein [Streptomyces sp. SID3343]MYW05336.1 tellurium resistance protein [Streptomyces sp. SID3343]
MASRPLHFFFLLDCSSSMQGEKIASLNWAVRESIPDMRHAAEENPAASLLVRVLTFSHGATWHLPRPTPVENFSWTDVKTSGATDMGAAFRLAAAELAMPPMTERALPPVLALLSDGGPTDDWRAGLAQLDATPWGKRALRVAIAIGQDADRAMLRTFLGNPEAPLLDVNDAEQLASAIRWVSTVAVRAASTPAGGGSTPAPFGAAKWTPPQPVEDDGADVW